ncbi:conserved hypothetical protein [Burkholderia cenocepacia HI2424]|uniref:Uncharacterized protein n=1 Tax=Burkholderia orbicola (strain AU 1054) TaxID=331271 RepID=A0A0H2XUU4_BURO1|nr:conserved hypothetical protein [Burkholderia cenocepacia HI2424]
MRCCRDCKGQRGREQKGCAHGGRPAGRRGRTTCNGSRDGTVAGSDPVVVDFLALAAFLVAATRAQTLARQDRDHLLGRRAGRQLVADAIGHHRQARTLAAQCLGDCPAAFVAVAIPFIADSLAITALFHPNSLTRLREWSRARCRTCRVPGGSGDRPFRGGRAMSG